MNKLELQKQIKKNGLSMEEAADKLGVSRTTLYSYFDKFEANELSPKLMETLFSTFHFDESFIKQAKDKRKSAGFTDLSFIIEDVNHEGGTGINAKFFDGTLYDTKALINLMTYNLPKSKYRILEVKSSFMSPTISAGDFVALEAVDAKFMIRPYDFYIYFIVAKTAEYLSRVLKTADDKWILKMDNSEEIITFNPLEISGLYIARRIYQLQDAGPKMFDVSASK